MNSNTKQVKGLSLLFLNLTKINLLGCMSKEGKSRLNYPPDTEKIINIKKIIVPCEIQRSYPNPKKLIEYTKRFEQRGMIDTAITIKKDIVFGTECYILINGYIRYLILKQNGIDEVPVKFEK